MGSPAACRRATSAASLNSSCGVVRRLIIRVTSTAISGSSDVVARRIDCGFLAQLVAEHRIEDWEAAELAQDLSYNLAKKAYNL